MSHLKREIAKKQKELKRLKRDLKFVHGRTRTAEARADIDKIEHEINDLGTALKSKEQTVGYYILSGVR